MGHPGRVGGGGVVSQPVEGGAAQAGGQVADKRTLATAGCAKQHQAALRGVRQRFERGERLPRPHLRGGVQADVDLRQFEGALVGGIGGVYRAEGQGVASTGAAFQEGAEGAVLAVERGIGRGVVLVVLVGDNLIDPRGGVGIDLLLHLLLHLLLAQGGEFFFEGGAGRIG